LEFAWALGFGAWKFNSICRPIHPYVLAAHTGIEPTYILCDFAQILPKSATISALNADRETVRIPDSRSVTQFPNLRQGYGAAGRVRICPKILGHNSGSEKAGRSALAGAIMKLASRSRA